MWPCVFCGTSWHWFFTSITAQPPTCRLLRESSIESFRRHRTRPALMPQEGVARCVQHRLSAPRARRNLLTHCNEFDSRVSLAFAHVRLCHAALRMTSWLSTLLVISAHRINTERRSLSDEPLSLAFPPEYGPDCWALRRALRYPVHERLAALGEVQATARQRHQ